MRYLFLTVTLAIAVLILRDSGRRRKAWTWCRFAAETATVATGVREPSPGYLQRAALYAVLALQTVGVTGRIQLPHHIELRMSPDAAAIADSFGSRFLGDILTAVKERAEAEAWQTDIVSILIVVDAAVRRFRPIARLGRRGPEDALSTNEIATEPMPQPDSVTLKTDDGDTIRCDGLELVIESHPELPRMRAGGTDDLLVVGRCGADRLVPLPTVSARHCQLRRLGGSGWSIEDLGSTNGTYLNGILIDGIAPLKLGDVVGLGRDVQLRYVQ